MRRWGFLLLACALSACTSGGSQDGRADQAAGRRTPEGSEPTLDVPGRWADFHLGEVHFLDANVGWAPTYRPCAGDGVCVVVYVTDDGGVTWTPRTDPPAQVKDSPDGQLTVVPVVRLVSNDVGWLIDINGNLSATSDGARPWHPEPQTDPVVDLEAVGGRAWRIDQTCPPTNDPCRYSVLTAGEGGSWERAGTQPLIGAGGVSSLIPWIALPSPEAAYVLSDRGHYPHADHSGDPGDTEWRPDPVLARTLDGGRTWTTLKPPCPAKGRGGEWGADLAASTDQDLWLVCSDAAGPRRIEPRRLHRSSDGGDHWTEDLGAPDTSSGGWTAAASPDNACRGGSNGIRCTRDGGRTWFVPTLEESGGDGIQVHQFVDSRHGWGIGQDGPSGNVTILWRTTDGGATWTSTRVGG